MTNPNKRRGDSFELECQAFLRDELGVPARRMLGAGRKDDVGDISGVPNTTVQCANRKDVAAAVRHKPLECERQQERARTLFGMTAIRLRGGERRWVLTDAQMSVLWREAQPLRVASSLCLTCGAEPPWASNSHSRGDE